MLARKRLSSKRILVLGGVLAVVWGTIGVIVYRSFFAKPASVPVGTPVILPGEPVTGVPGGTVTVPTQDFDRSILQDPRLVNLKVFGEVPLEVRARGKQNPFESYEP